MSVVEAGIPVGAVDAAACPLCSAQASHESHAAKPAVDRRDDLVPWAIGLTAAVLIASVGVGTDRWFGIGAAAGLGAGALCAWQSVRSAIRLRAKTHEREIQALSDDADGRVGMVIRQFEWAVNDVAKLRREHERAQVTADLLIVQGRARERHIRKLEREILEAREREARLAAATRPSQRAEFDPSADVASSVGRLRWGLHHNGAYTRIELECDARAYRPTRLRIVAPDGTVPTESMTAMHSGDGSLCFALAEPPADFVAGIVSGEDAGYRIEAQCDYEWRPVLLEDTGLRTRQIQDKHGRLFRVNEAPLLMPRAAVVPLAVAHNPFDHSFETTLTLL
jgi:hypothetical protein